MHLCRRCRRPLASGGAGRNSGTGDEQGSILGPHLNNPGEDLVVRGEDLPIAAGSGYHQEPLNLVWGTSSMSRAKAAAASLGWPRPACARPKSCQASRSVGRARWPERASAELCTTTPWLAQPGLPSGHARPAPPWSRPGRTDSRGGQGSRPRAAGGSRVPGSSCPAAASSLARLSRVSPIACRAAAGFSWAAEANWAGPSFLPPCPRGR